MPAATPPPCLRFEFEAFTTASTSLEVIFPLTSLMILPFCSSICSTIAEALSNCFHNMISIQTNRFIRHRVQLLIVMRADIQDLEYFTLPYSYRYYVLTLRLRPAQTLKAFHHVYVTCLVVIVIRALRIMY